MTGQWSYQEAAGCCGPSEWNAAFGAGHRQSPIDIRLPASARNDGACCRGVGLMRLSPGQQQQLAGDNKTNNNNDILDGDRCNGTDSDYGGSPTQLVELGKQNTRARASNKKVFLGYPRFVSRLRLSNTGHGWCATLPDALGAHTLLAGPAFGARAYRLLQFHAHWGADANAGSEHTIDGRQFSAELHFVHWNCSDFESAEAAASARHGLAVLAVLVEARDGAEHRNRHLDKISLALRAVGEPDSSTTLADSLDIKKLFPANRWRYATYEGSLTTPPLSEVVEWLVFLNPIRCSTAQLAEFRSLRAATSCGDVPLSRNWRPTQTLNGRQVTVWTHH